MKVVAAYLLARLGGNMNPSAEDLKKILGSVGAEADDAMIELLLSSVKNKDITELIAAGKENLKSFAPAAASAVQDVAASNSTVPSAAEAKKEEKKEEIKEESDDDFILGLFD